MQGGGGADASRSVVATMTLTLLVVLLAVAVPPPATSQTSIADQPALLPARVSDPVPAPNAVVAPGPVVIAAAVDGVEPDRVRFLVDGERASGPFVDPDGPLSPRRGVEATLSPGPHEVGIEVDGRILRRWTVDVSGLAVEPVAADPSMVAARVTGASRTVVLVNPDHPAATAVMPAAVALDARVLPVPRLEVPGEVWTALRDVGDDVRVLVAGDETAIGEVVVGDLRDAGFAAVRLDAGTLESMSLAAADRLAALPESDPARAALDAVVVAPAAPVAVAVRAAETAARLGATVLLVDGAVPSPVSLARIAAARTVLASSGLSAEARTAVVEALAEGAVLSDDRLAPRRAGEALVVVDPARTDLGVVALRTAADNRAVLLGLDEGRAWVAAHRPDRVVLVGGTAAEAEALHAEWVDGVGQPGVEPLIDATDGLSVTLSADVPLERAEVHVDLLGFEWTGDVVVEDGRAVWTGGQRPRLPEALEPPGPGTPARIDVTALVGVGTARRHLRFVGQVELSPLTSVSSDGFLVAGGSSPVVGVGPLRTFSVEVERSTGLDVDAVAAEVTEILLDPRGWTADGTRSLQRIGSSAAADLRVVVARPETVDYYCGRVGLRTGGRVSCWDGFRAMLNLDRWNTGVAPFHSDVTVYRQYLVSHELGHGLGYGHEFCLRPGTLAPVMMQQTGGIGACLANGWPHPTVGNIVAVG